MPQLRCLPSERKERMARILMSMHDQTSNADNEHEPESNGSVSEFTRELYRLQSTIPTGLTIETPVEVVKKAQEFLAFFKDSFNATDEQICKDFLSWKEMKEYESNQLAAQQSLEYANPCQNSIQPFQLDPTSTFVFGPHSNSLPVEQMPSQAPAPFQPTFVPVAVDEQSNRHQLEDKNMATLSYNQAFDFYFAQFYSYYCSQFAKEQSPSHASDAFTSNGTPSFYSQESIDSMPEPRNATNSYFGHY